jgi:hypothetical protein
MLYKYVAANPSGHTVYGAGFSYLVSAMAGSNPAEVMVIR